MHGFVSSCESSNCIRTLTTDRTSLTTHKSFKVNIWHTVHVGGCVTDIPGYLRSFQKQQHAVYCFVFFYQERQVLSNITRTQLQDT